MFFSAFVTPATPRTPAGGRACGTPSPTGGLVFRSRLVRQFARIRAVSAAYVRKFYWKLLIKKIALAGASGAERTAREKTGADHRPRARQWPGYVRRARGVLQTALMGLITALRQRNRPKWTSRTVSRGGFFVTTQTQTTGFFNTTLSILMVGLISGGEARWVSGSGMHRKVVPLRTSTWGRPEKLHERAPTRLCSL